MQLGRRAEFQRAHIPHMGKIVLYARGRTRHARVGHRHAANDQSLEHGLHRGLVAAHQPFGILHAFFQRIADHLRHTLTVILAGDDMCNAPFSDAHIFCQHIAKAGAQHMQRRVFENVNIADDHIRAARRQRHLKPVERHRRRRAGVAVHRRRGSDDNVLSSGQAAQNLSDVVDNARANADDEVAAIIKVHHRRADRVLIGLQCILRENIAGIRKPRLLQNPAHRFSGGGNGIFVRQHKGSFCPVSRDKFR